MRIGRASIIYLFALTVGCGQPNGTGESSFPTIGAREESPELGPLILDSQVMRQDPFYHGSGGENTAFDPECVITEDGVEGIGFPQTLVNLKVRSLRTPP